MTGQEVVVKLIDLHRMSKRRQEQTREQVPILEACRHSNIESYVESFECRGRLYIVSERHSGGNLIEHIEKAWDCDPLSEDAAK